MGSDGQGREHRGQLQPNRPFAASHGLERRKTGGGQLHRKARPVDLDVQRAHHQAPVGALLLVGQRSVAITIDVREDRVRHGDARRQVQLDLHAAGIESESRRLQVFVPPMRRHLGDTDDHHRQGQRAARHVYFRVNFAP